MKRKVDEFAKAIELRKSGLGIIEISKTLNVSKASVSVWVRGIRLNEDQLDALKRRALSPAVKKILKGQSELNRNKASLKRNEYRERGFYLAERDEMFLLISSLYWAEGSKSRNSFIFVNSDISMLKIICHWLNDFTDKEVRVDVRYYAENGINELQIKKHWFREIPILKNTKKWKFKLFKQEIRRDSQKRGIGKLPFGTASVSVCSTEIVQNIYGGIQYIKDKHKMVS